MQMSCLTSFLVILVFDKNNHCSQDSPQGTCQVWGDPHLVMFPTDPAQESLRMSYWCQSPGRMLVLKNIFIEVYVNVTDAPYWNEYYEIKLLADSQAFCTITHAQRTCKSKHVSVLKINSGLDILYQDADNLSVTVNSYMIHNRAVYDIHITQSYKLILRSSGLCINKSPSCRLEKAANLFGKHRRRDVDKTNATQVCDEYMKEAYKTANTFLGYTDSSMKEHVRVACIKDVSVSGNPEWGQSAINFVAMDALKKSGLKNAERLEMLQEIVPAIEKAALRAEENSHHWMRPILSHIIST